MEERLDGHWGCSTRREKIGHGGCWEDGAGRGWVRERANHVAVDDGEDR